jgi:hypothetical protein
MTLNHWVVGSVRTRCKSFTRADLRAISEFAYLPKISAHMRFLSLKKLVTVNENKGPN